MYDHTIGLVHNICFKLLLFEGASLHDNTLTTICCKGISFAYVGILKFI